MLLSEIWLHVMRHSLRAILLRSRANYLSCSQLALRPVWSLDYHGVLKSVCTVVWIVKTEGGRRKKKKSSPSLHKMRKESL